MNKKVFLFLFLNLFISTVFSQTDSDSFGPITIVVHGGAGTITKANLTEEMEKAFTDKLSEAVLTGYNLLEQGETSLNVILATIKLLEDSPLFNAGKGAVFNHEGKNEMDASIMDGATLDAGAISGVTNIKNPIEAAYKVMTQSPHVFLSGTGAEEFAKSQGLEMVDPSYFYTENRFQQLKKARELEKGKSELPVSGDYKFGTVGVVVLDKYGNIAAGTSTGGMTNKRWGRIGDSPIIGAGTYADNASCAVSGTGHGEFFIRDVVAYNIAARIKYGKMDLNEAANEVIHNELAKMGGTGGVICLDRKGNIAMPFNTEGMYRGYKQKGKELVVLIYK